MKPKLIYHENWETAGKGTPMETMVFRIPGGILHEVFADGNRHTHLFSPRPYVPGQPNDGTIEDCVYALLFDYCEAKRIDPAALHTQAYNDPGPYHGEERARIIRRAMAEGVAFPETWDEDAFLGLVKSLREVGAAALAAVLAEGAGP